MNPVVVDTIISVFTNEVVQAQRVAFLGCTIACPACAQNACVKYCRGLG